MKTRAVRMVRDHRPDYPSQWAAITSIAQKIGCTTETLRRWVQQAERDVGARDRPQIGTAGPAWLRVLRVRADIWIDLAGANLQHG